ncbi:hypothetical protein [Pseudarthrobacter cellobiosi]|uniref:hypothetical protein n=1 Tax=Pseudarthrobacter cellobiosi TaxID=2953654 RepID=UPI00208E07E8|nr:hypothetical protein [Pseudarthrobacter sp. HLT1-5]MCO4255962.1 hypothetical protein [Pseudarthrobacter sp. HLT1-5]
MASFATYLAIYGFLGFVSVNVATTAAAAALRSLPSNMTDEARVLARLDGRMVNTSLSGALTSLGLEPALPVRAFFSRQGKRNYEGQVVVQQGAAPPDGQGRWHRIRHGQLY